MAKKAGMNQAPTGSPVVPPTMESALAKNGWKRRDQPPLKWEEGITVEGHFVKLVPSKSKDMSPVLHVDTVDGRVRYWCPAVLEQRVGDFSENEAIFIICLGKKEPTPNGLAWAFDVFGK